MFEGIELLRETLRLRSLQKILLSVYEALCCVCRPVTLSCGSIRSSQLLCWLRSGLLVSPDITVPQNIAFLSSSAGSAVDGGQRLTGELSLGSKRNAGPVQCSIFGAGRVLGGFCRVSGHQLGCSLNQHISSSSCQSLNLGYSRANEYLEAAGVGGEP